MSDIYNEKYFAWQKTIVEFGGVANIFKFIPHVQPSDTVLDFGCVGGYLLKNLTCARRLGVEVNPVASQKAMENGIDCHVTLDTIVDASVDVIISNHALEHVPCPLKTLTDLRAKLRSGGHLVMVVPCEANTLPYDAKDVNQHLYTWNPQLLGNLACQAGFRVEEVSPIFHKWPPRFLDVQRILGWNLFHLISRLYGYYKRLDFQVKLVAQNTK